MDSFDELRDGSPENVSSTAGWQGEQITRREALRRFAVGGALLTTIPLVGPLGLKTLRGSEPRTSALSVRPKYGGTLRAGLLGGSSSDTLEADNLISFMDLARGFNLYDPLASFDREMGLTLRLAEELRPITKTADQWLIRLREGVHFHNGKPLTSSDVAFTFQRIVHNKFEGLPLISTINVNGIKLLDDLSLSVPFHQPFSVFDQALGSGFFNIVPIGYNPHKPVGTGPFMFKSFSPGQQSTFVRNPNYWQKGLPYVDELVLIDFADQTSAQNALLGGEVDMIDEVAVGGVSTLKGASMQIVVNKGVGFDPLCMRVDTPPFNDLRVRQAMRLIIDRPQSVEVALGGYGEVANDLFCPLDPDFDHALPQRVRDIGKAKSLLKASGHEGLSVQLITAPLGSGIVETAEVFAQNASAAGVKVNLRNVTEGDLFGPSYLKWTFSQDIWSAEGYLVQVLESMLPNSPYNETHWNNPTYNRLASTALATVDPVSRKELVHEMQTIEYEEGGYIIPYYPWPVDALASNVRGCQPSRTGWPLDTFGFSQMWLE
jgi:peptide/nickel transport system substrate-binding protein